jgi:hypothetical protein
MVINYNKNIQKIRSINLWKPFYPMSKTVGNLDIACSFICITILNNKLKPKIQITHITQRVGNLVGILKLPYFMQRFLCSRTFCKNHVCYWVSVREVFSNFLLRFHKMDIVENVHFAWPQITHSYFLKHYPKTTFMNFTYQDSLFENLFFDSLFLYFYGLIFSFY